MSKPILCLDFDGVIHSYSSGWQGADVIPDPPVAGAMEFLDRARAKFRLAIYSSRSCQPNGILAMRLWLQLQLGRYCGKEEALAEEIFSAIEWPVEKPAAFLTIDDRALQFTGVWPELDSMLTFLPWNKRHGSGEIRSPSYEALLLIANSVSAALTRAGVADCDDPGEAIDVLRERYEARIASITGSDHAARSEAPR